MLDSDKMLILDVGARIRDLRDEKGFTLRDIAKRSGLPKFHMVAIEGGKHAATVETLHAIATALDVTMVDLFNDGKDDAGFILEVMRHHPDAVPIIGEHVRRLVVN